jgi:hypothetical protein
MAAVEETIATGTARIEQTVSAEGSTVLQDFETAPFLGQASFGTDHRMYVIGDYTDLMGIGETELIREGNLVYIGGELAEQITDRAPWVLVDLESDDPAAAPFLGIASGQSDLSIPVYYFLGMSPDVQVANDNAGAGGPRRRFTGQIDLVDARAAIPAAYADALEYVLATMRVSGMSSVLAGTAWVRDGVIEELSFTFELGRQQGGGTMTSTIAFSDLGQPLDYEIPDDSEIIRIEDVDTPLPGTET